MNQKFPYQPFRNVLLNLPAQITDIPLHELLQQPAPTVVGSMHGLWLQNPPIVLTGPDHHQPELLNPEALNTALQTMIEKIDNKIRSLKTIQLNSDQLSPGLVYLCRELLDPYQRMMSISSDPHNGEKAWSQFIRQIETDPHLKKLVEHHLCNDQPLSVRHYKILLLGSAKERSIHNALKPLRKRDINRGDDNTDHLADSDDDGKEKNSAPLPADTQPDQPTSHEHKEAPIKDFHSAFTNIRKAVGEIHNHE